MCDGELVMVHLQNRTSLSDVACPDLSSHKKKDLVTNKCFLSCVESVNDFRQNQMKQYDVKHRPQPTIWYM